MPGRWIVLLIVSILLHVVSLEWASGNIGIPSLQNQNPIPIVAALRPAQPAPEPLVAPAPKPAQPKPVAKPKPRPAAPRSVVAATEPAISASTETTLPPSQAGIEAPGTSIEPAIALAPAAEAGIPPNESKATAAQASGDTRYKVSLPPSAELKYDVQALREGQMVYGRGKITWQSDGGNYTVNGEAGILFFTVLNFTSAGAIDDFGVAPVLYSEKRFRKSETNTHFHRERNTISFSASTASYPRKGGEQDRASIIWQLAGIGRGGSGKIVPGAEIDIFVAGARDAEMWRIHVIGEEEIEVGTGKTMAWHVMRAPRAGSYDKKLDIWLAPQQQWYPVRLRETETNGDYLDMSLSTLTVADAN